ncbi:hypothetical protein HZC53_01080 [Candidatus Uhrbacteria bacterium]|nr:hypothetical protein [Candidatus Uhrbacteria bacterium]
MNFATERATVEYDETQVDETKLAKAIEDNGYEAVLEKQVASEHAMHMEHGMSHTEHGAPKEEVSHLAHGGYVDRKGLIASFILVIPLVVSMFVMPEIGAILGYSDLKMIVVLTQTSHISGCLPIQK